MFTQNTSSCSELSGPVQYNSYSTHYKEAGKPHDLNSCEENISRCTLRVCDMSLLKFSLVSSAL